MTDLEQKPRPADISFRFIGQPIVRKEDALIAALKVKCERPDALINYVRRRNKRGDLRHPHGPIAAKAG